jgi:hypothetical protein
MGCFGGDSNPAEAFPLLSIVRWEERSASCQTDLRPAMVAPPFLA